MGCAEGAKVLRGGGNVLDPAGGSHACSCGG